MFESILRGVPSLHLKKKTEHREDQIYNVLQNRGNISVIEFFK